MNDAICQLYCAKSGLARFVYRRMTNMLNKSIEKGKPDLNITFIYNMPFRGIAKMAGGMCTMEMAEGILTIVNGHFFLKTAERRLGEMAVLIKNLYSQEDRSVIE